MWTYSSIDRCRGSMWVREVSYTFVNPPLLSALRSMFLSPCRASRRSPMERCCRYFSIRTATVPAVGLCSEYSRVSYMALFFLWCWWRVMYVFLSPSIPSYQSIVLYCGFPSVDLIVLWVYISWFNFISASGDRNWNPWIEKIGCERNSRLRIWRIGSAANSSWYGDGPWNDSRWVILDKLVARAMPN